MRIRITIAIFISQFLSLSSICQRSVKSIDKILSDSYRRLQNSEDNIRYDSVAPAFKKEILRYLSSPLTLDNKLDSLETLITIRQSLDKRIKFYSWDELTGGTWHQINSFAQFKGAGNKILYIQLDTDKEDENGGFTDSDIYDVYEVREGQNVYYLTFGWGTHDGGVQHQIVYLFKIKGDKLIKCKAFNSKSELIFEYSRRDRINIKFNKKNNTLSFDEFLVDEAEQFPQKTGKRKHLKFLNGSFR